MDARRALAIALTVTGFACRLCAIALCALTVLLCLSGIPTKLGIASFVIDLTQALPDIVAGYGLIPTPLGGVFRFDFLLTALALFTLDYACARFARNVR